MKKKRTAGLLCMMLAAALVFGSVPGTAVYAEEYAGEEAENTAMEAAEDTADEELYDAPGAGEAAVAAEAETQDTEAGETEAIDTEADDTEAAAAETGDEEAQYGADTYPEESAGAAGDDEVLPETEDADSVEPDASYGSEDEMPGEPLDETEEETLTEIKEEPLDDAAEPEEPDGAQIFVERCYRVILGREPDEEGLADWTDRIRNGNKTASDILKGFFASAEYTGNKYPDSTYIELLYKAALNRSADATGLRNRSQELEYGFTKTYVLRYITGSSEFRNKCAALGIEPGTVTLTDTLDLNPDETRYVYSLYRNILGRKPDRSGQVNNVKALLSSGARPLVVKFFRSSEYTKKKTSDTQFIKDVFVGALQRSAEESAVNNRLAMFENGLSRMYVLKNVLSSSEFVNKAAKRKVEAGTFPESVLENRDKDPKTTKFVLLSYKNGLNRKASASELNKACGLMLSGERKAFDQLHHIAFSAEGKRKASSDKDFVKMVFALILQRAPKEAELTKYEELLGGVTNREEVFDRIAFGAEGVKVTKKYGYSIKDKYKDFYGYAAERLDASGWDLKKAYDWICTKEWSRVGVFDSEPSRWHADYFFENDTGDCYAMAGAFYEMAKLMNYDVHQIAGHIVFMSGALGKHSWVEIVVNGTTYIVDPDTQVEVGLNAWFVYYGQPGTLKYAEYTRMN